jgi:hypothetical protein
MSPYHKQFNSLPEITGLPFVKKSNRWISATHINGEPHRQRDKTYAILKDKGIYIIENGGDDISLPEWLRLYGDLNKLREDFEPSPSSIKRQDKPRIFVDKFHIESTLPMNYKGNLFNYLSSVFGRQKVERVFKLYVVGEHLTIENTIFWYANELGEVCHDVIIKYGPDGHRIKDSGAGRKFQIEDGYSARCLFGQHLLNCDTKEVAVVESEKTALVMAISDNKPGRIWLATGGSNHWANIREGWKLFPDFDKAGAKWECIGCRKRKDECRDKVGFGCINANKDLVRWFDQRGVTDKMDVADWVINYKIKK